MTFSVQSVLVSNFQRTQSFEISTCVRETNQLLLPADVQVKTRLLLCPLRAFTAINTVSCHVSLVLTRSIKLAGGGGGGGAAARSVHNKESCSCSGGALSGCVLHYEAGHVFTASRPAATPHCSVECVRRTHTADMNKDGRHCSASPTRSFHEASGRRLQRNRVRLLTWPLTDDL